MYSSEKRLDEFIKSHLGPKNFLKHLCKLEKEKITTEIKKEKKEFEKTKQYFLKEAEELFVYNTSNFKSSSVGFKYHLELLDDNNSDCKLLRDSLGLNNKENNCFARLKRKHKKPNFYKLKAPDEDVKESSDIPSLLLLHGTKAPNVEGILKEGFKPSREGKFGPGVYLTDSFEMAFKYGHCFVNDEGVPKKSCYVFVNKVKYATAERPYKILNKEKCNDKKPERINIKFAKPNYCAAFTNGTKYELPRTTSAVGANSFDDYNNQDPVLKVYKSYGFTRKPTNFKSSSHDSFDSEMNQIIGGTFHVAEHRKMHTAVAHPELVTPAYLIEIEEDMSLSELAQYLLYKWFDVRDYSGKTCSSEHSKTKGNIFEQVSYTNVDAYSIETLMTQLEQEIVANQQAQIELLKRKFDYNVGSLKKQLSFETSTLFTTTSIGCTKYKTDALQTLDDDYQFVLKSLGRADCKKIPKVLHMFRINPLDQYEAGMIQNSSLYWHGVPANKVENILTSGYFKYQGKESLAPFREHCKKECFNERILLTRNCFCRGSASLSREILKGASYCYVESEVRKLSFVFVASNPTIKSDNLGKDGRGCSFARIRESEVSVGCTHDGSIPTLSSIPAYLVLFEI